MSTYLIGGKEVDKSAEDLQEILKRIYGQKDRPLCLCKGGEGVKMYVSRIHSDFYVIKRMPNTGQEHALDCESFEPPEGLSGLGEVNGQAIKEDPESGNTTIKFDFSLSKGARRAPPSSGGEEKDSVKSDGKKLTLRGTLHYLWEEAGFNKWSPAMEGKRNWGVIRRYLLNAAVNKLAKGEALANLIYIPEVFNVDQKDQIRDRREKLLRAMATDKEQRGLMILVAEVKEFKEAGFGYQMTVKHVPDRHFVIDSDLGKRLVKRFRNELEAWPGLPGTKLLTIATFSVSQNVVAKIEEMSLVTVNENWLPYDNGAEKALVDKLIEEKRRFTKMLRYNLPSTRPIATAVLQDRGEGAEMTAMYVVPLNAEPAYLDALNRVIEESGIRSWMWDENSESTPPALP